MRLPARLILQGAGLGFLAGYVDTVGFVALFGLFTAHVTGNFVLIGSELARPSNGVLLIKFLAFPAFIAGVALTRLLSVALEKRGRPATRPTLLMQLVLLCGFMLAGIWAAPIGATPSALAVLAGVLGAASMGVQNASSKLLYQQLTPTTVMTGNVTQLVIDLVDIARGDRSPALHARCVKFFWPIVAFGLGATGGGLGYVHFGFAALLLPIGILVSMIGLHDGDGDAV